MPTSDMTDKEYEKLIQNIHKAIMSNEGMSSIAVEHDKKVVGRSGQPHQIDVYWSYQLAGVTYQTAIECKKYKSSISVGKVRDFFGVLSDIGNIQGIMVTTNGYQSGSKTLADHYGIKLAIVRDVVELDVSGFINTIVLEMNAIFNKVTKWNISVSQDVIKSHGGDMQDLQITGLSNEIGLFDASGNLVRSFHDIENSLPYNNNEGQMLSGDQTHNLTLDIKDMYLKHETMGLIPVDRFSVDYRISSYTTVSHIQDPNPTNFIFENFGKDGETLYIHEEKGDIHIKRRPKSEEEPLP